MKTLDELRKTPRLGIIASGVDGGAALAHLLSNRRNNHPATVIFSFGGGWDHVSVSYSNRTPTWEEMCEVKEMFFRPDEVAVEYHPSEAEYVNRHPYCLHIWRPQEAEIPTPPAWMVGPKRGQTDVEAYREGDAALRERGEM